MTLPIVLLIDGHNLAYRTFHQPSLQRLRRDDGKKSGVFYGFLTGIHKLLVKFHPHQLVVVFDDFEGSRRTSAQYDGYKSGRKKPKKSFLRQVHDLRECLLACGINVISVPGVEADDILFHLSKWVAASRQKAIIVSSDHDMLQAISKSVWVWDDRMRLMWSPKIVRTHAKYGFKPKYIPIYKALSGDVADNVKGVHGFGPKKAKEFIAYLDRCQGDLSKTCIKFLSRSEQNVFMRTLPIVQIQPDQKLIQFVTQYAKLKRPIHHKRVKHWLTLYGCRSMTARFPVWIKQFQLAG